MQPPKAKTVTITLFDGKERILRYPFSTCKLIYEKFGEQITMMNFGEVLWHGLRDNDPDLTIEQVEYLCDPTMRAYLEERIEMAMGKRPIPDLEKNEESVRLTEAVGHQTGSASGVSDASNSDSQTASSGT
jgi:hypothetical protein